MSTGTHRLRTAIQWIAGFCLGRALGVYWIGDTREAAFSLGLSAALVLWCVYITVAEATR